MNNKNQKFPISDRAKAFYEKYYPDSDIHNWNSWTWQLRNRIKSVKQLEAIFDLSESEQAIMKNKPLTGKLPIAITPYYASLIDANFKNAIRRTVVPVDDEMCDLKEEAFDPLSEDATNPVKGIIHRYPDRVLFLATNVCAVNCRYCTRSRMARSESMQKMDIGYWKTAIEYIREHSEIRDVVISGGDPLVLSDSRIDWLLTNISSIKHVEIMRIGTKISAVLPQRITVRLLRILKKYKNLYLSVHFTHPDEVTIESKEACNRLADIGVPLGSQTVLLKGINDNVQTMTKLYHELLKVRVRPYYLYQCDLVLGTSHFRTSIEKGREILKGLIGHTSGYAVPHYVVDTAEGIGKIPIIPSY